MSWPHGVITSLCLTMFAGSSVAQTSAGVPGAYCLIGVREVGSCFKFQADGTFEYYLSYGAYDESSEGRWRREGDDVVLDSPPYERKPQFKFRERRRAENDQVHIVVETASGRGLAGVDVRVTCGGVVVEGHTQSDGYGTGCVKQPLELELGVRMIGLPFQRVLLDSPASSGQTLVFEFEPGDLGKRSFAGTRLSGAGTHEFRMTFRSTTLPELDRRLFVYQRN